MVWLGENEIEHVLATVIQNLLLLSKKDASDKRLPMFWPIVDRFLATRNASVVASFAIMVGSQLKPQKNSHIPALENSVSKCIGIVVDFTKQRTSIISVLRREIIKLFIK